MNEKKILITGGLGFLGFSCAKNLKKKNKNYKIILFDNLQRKGSEKNIPAAIQNGFNFINGDISKIKDLLKVKNFDLMLHFAAEPSVTIADRNPIQTISTNLLGTANCLHLCSKYDANIIFISSSRVYNLEEIDSLIFKENINRVVLKNKNIKNYIKDNEITENFPCDQKKSFYGATKLASEIILKEYLNNFNMKGIINRCSVISGPGQFGKKEQGIFMYWLKSHMDKKKLSYIGYKGKQVRDILHIDDFCNLIDIQIKKINILNNEIFNIGGGYKNSVSLKELTILCQKITGNKVKININNRINKNDVKYFVISNKKIYKKIKWKPIKNIKDILEDTYSSLKENKK
jgi:CDP-paratose 2-epimerase